MRNLCFVLPIFLFSSFNSLPEPIGHSIGMDVFNDKCKACHGKKGTWRLMAKRLSTSTKTIDEAIEIITNGKGRMPAYKDRLTKDQIKAVAAYIQELKIKRD